MQNDTQGLLTDQLFTNNLLCFSHLRWGFVYQRPQHLISRFAKKTRVFFIEEPIYHDGNATLNISLQDNVYVVTPHLQHGTHGQAIQLQQELINNLLISQQITGYISWYYTPMALPFTRQLQSALTVYDCMDELAAFKFAPAELVQLEKELLDKADVVFTGGHTIYQSKKHSHPNIHPFPSSIDKAHFAQGRQTGIEPEDQRNIPHPRLGFYGVIDERFDIELIRQVAEARPDWHFVLIGPIVKIDPAHLPQFPNIHYPGGRKYDELPLYLSGWDIALIPFAINESTKFISPTKTPEYLAAGKPVISTPITDVIHPYGDEHLVYIASTADEFLSAANSILNQTDRSEWLQKTDAFLADISWDQTWDGMVSLMAQALQNQSSTKKQNQKKETLSYV
jgi:glycosyltransferase involved in cell wall biosynthesis